MNVDLYRGRAAMHRALGDPSRLAVVDALALGEASPVELQALLEMPSNLLAHHVRVLEQAGIVRRTPSEGDRRRTYVGLVPGALDALAPAVTRDAPRVVFVCTQNSARSQLAAAIWNAGSPVPATSAGTRPATRVHPGAVAAARRHAIAMNASTPRRAADVLRPDDLVITVCDQAHEELDAVPGAAHWSVADPARDGGESAFDTAVTDLAGRISRLAPTVRPTTERSA
jgi:protein-tyrosine-phosphatase/DNA-binding transcriptional ArsR family regulator